MIESLKNVLEKQITCFCVAIKKAVEKGSSPYECIIMPEHTINIEYDYLRNLMRLCIWDHLISGVFPKWLKIFGKRCLVPVDQSGRRHAGEVYSPRIFSMEYPFAFILEDNGKRIAYRYCDYKDECDEEKVRRSIRHYHINSVRIINWTKTDSLKSQNHFYHCCNVELENRTEHITLCDFMNMYFPREVCPLYIDMVKKAVVTANKMIGYQTIANLSPKHLREFKQRIINDLVKFDLKNTQYSKFDREGNLTNEKYDLLQPKDFDIISKQCFSNNLVYSLTGQNGFSICFITSEHLYHIFKNDNQYRYDYSAVVSGYFKSVELLLKEAMRATFSHPNHESLWIKGNKNHLRDEDKDILWRYDPIIRSKDGKNTKSVQLKFIESNEAHFSTEMGPLIRFIDDNHSGWNISDLGRESVIKCLKNFAGCRNAHLHKGIISDFNTVETIRNNTMLCLLYLLGGYKIYDDLSVSSTNLEVYNQEYNRLYMALKEISSSENCFFIKPYNEETIKVIRLYDQKETEYDETGNIITAVEFAIVDSFSIGDYSQFLSRIMPSQKLTITKDNIPEKIWWCSYCNGQEIKRGEVEWKTNN